MTVLPKEISEGVISVEPWRMWETAHYVDARGGEQGAGGLRDGESAVYFGDRTHGTWDEREEGIKAEC